LHRRDDGKQAFGLGSVAGGRHAQEDTTPQAIPNSVAKNQFAEVIVLGQENAVITRSSSQYLKIGGAAHRLEDRSDILMLVSHRVNDFDGDALVNEPAHLLSAEGDFIMCDVVGGKCLGGPNVISCQVRMVGNYRFNGSARSQFAQDQFDRDARAAHDRFSRHYVRINFDSRVFHGRFRSLSSLT